MILIAMVVVVMMVVVRGIEDSSEDVYTDNI